MLHHFWMTVAVSIAGAAYLSRYVTSHSGRLSLAIPSWVGSMSKLTSQKTVTPRGWGVHAGTVHVWVGGKTVIPLLHMGHI